MLELYMAVITIPRALRDKLGEDGTDAFIEVMQSVETESRKDLATKEDLAKLEGNLRLEIEKSKSDIIKWVAAMLVAQSAAIAALVRLFGLK
ncbi:MAG: hypothetical protein HQK96_18575 [Nitrospirae bacterium]|nr:hypothetical protein [Nitrospirota bacterium]